MHTFFCPFRNITSDKIILNDKNQVHHIKGVLRLKTKEEVMIFDDRNNSYTAKIEGVSSKDIILQIKDKRISNTAQKMHIAVACAIPKRAKMDDIIDKLTQLGIDRIIPLKTERVIVELDKDKALSRAQHWKKVAVSASEQSQRKTLPVIEPLTDIKELLNKNLEYDLKLIPTLFGERKQLKEILRSARPKNILVLIGPEGDFSPSEVKLAEEKGFVPISLGDTVLRVDTATIAIASFLRLFTGTLPDTFAGTVPDR